MLDPYHGIERGWESAETSLAMIEETMQLEGPADNCRPSYSKPWSAPTAF